MPITVRSRRSRTVSLGMASKQSPPFAAVQHPRLAGRHHVLGTTPGRSRVSGHHLAGDEPVEQRSALRRAAASRLAPRVSPEALQPSSPRHEIG